MPFSRLQYDGDGKVKIIPANGKAEKVAEQYRVTAYPTIEKYGLVWIWWCNETAEIPEIPFFDDLKEGFHYAQVTDHWPIHYTRCIENQMDVVHLPFVHHNTIGRGGKTIVYGPKIKWEDDMLTWYVKNVVDDGKLTAKPASEMEAEEYMLSLQIIMPNIWHNIIADKLRVFAAFAPIDDENTMIYLRFYQAFMPIWGIKHIIGFFGKIYSKVILRQDKRVVITQIPKAGGLSIGEKLIPGDSPIIEFRKRRDLLKKANNKDA